MHGRCPIWHVLSWNQYILHRCVSRPLGSGRLCLSPPTGSFGVLLARRSYSEKQVNIMPYYPDSLLDWPCRSVSSQTYRQSQWLTANPVMWGLRKKFPNNQLFRQLHPVMFLYGGINWAPYNLSYMWPSVPIACISWLWLKKRYLGFWSSKCGVFLARESQLIIRRV